jgi:tungstate transport system permease protein
VTGRVLGRCLANRHGRLGQSAVLGGADDVRSTLNNGAPRNTRASPFGAITILGLIRVYKKGAAHQNSMSSCQQLAPHVLMPRPSVISIISKLQNFADIVALSISVSLAATAAATVISLPLGTALAIFPFRGRRLIVVLVNAFFGLPPVVVGLVLYLTLSRSGPLGSLALLFTPAAMVIAQTILAIPIITALVHRASERAWARYGDKLITDGATRLQAVPQLLMIIRADLVTAVLAGFGRTVSEVGAVILVGGNIRGLTRTMTTTIALQTSQGDLSLALALGAVLVGISISISATVFALAGRARTAGSDEV